MPSQTEIMVTENYSLFDPSTEINALNFDNNWAITNQTKLLVILNQAYLIRMMRDQYIHEYMQLKQQLNGPNQDKIIEPEVSFKRWLKRQKITYKEAQKSLQRLEVLDLLKEGGLEDEQSLGHLTLTQYDLLIQDEVPAEFIYLCADLLNKKKYDAFEYNKLNSLLATSQINFHPQAQKLLKQAVEEHNIGAIPATEIMFTQQKIKQEKFIQDFSEDFLANYFQEFNEIEKKQATAIIKGLKALIKIDDAFYLCQHLHSLDEADIENLLREGDRNEALTELGNSLSLAYDIIKLLHNIMNKQSKLAINLDKLYVKTGSSTPYLRKLIEQLEKKLIKNKINIQAGSKDVIDLLPPGLQQESV